MTRLACANAHHHVGHYLMGIGILSVLSRSHPTMLAHWEREELCVNLDRGILIDLLLNIARAGAWRAPTARQYHPLFAQWGRREPHTWQPFARELLRDDQRRTELEALIDGESFIIRRPPTTWNGKVIGEATFRAYGMGTIYPNTVPDRAGSGIGAALSPWQAVLAWEALCWIGVSTVSMQDYAWSNPSDVAPYKAWHAVTWDTPVELRRAQLLWRPRGRFAGELWSDWLKGQGAPLLRPFGRLSLHRHQFRQTDGSKCAEAFGSIDHNATRALNAATNRITVGSPRMALSLPRRMEWFRELRSTPVSEFDAWTEVPESVRRWYAQQANSRRADSERMPKRVQRFLERRGVQICG
jgi:hypothetical protein